MPHQVLALISKDNQIGADGFRTIDNALDQGAGRNMVCAGNAVSFVNGCSQTRQFLSGGIEQSLL